MYFIGIEPKGISKLKPWGRTDGTWRFRREKRTQILCSVWELVSLGSSRLPVLSWSDFWPLQCSKVSRGLIGRVSSQREISRETRGNLLLDRLSPVQTSRVRRGPSNHWESFERRSSTCGTSARHAT